MKFILTSSDHCSNSEFFALWQKKLLNQSGESMLKVLHRNVLVEWMRKAKNMCWTGWVDNITTCSSIKYLRPQKLYSTDGGSRQDYVCLLGDRKKMINKIRESIFFLVRKFSDICNRISTDWIKKTSLVWTCRRKK